MCPVRLSVPDFCSFTSRDHVESLNTMSLRGFLNLLSATLVKCRAMFTALPCASRLGIKLLTWSTIILQRLKCFTCSNVYFEELSSAVKWLKIPNHHKMHSEETLLIRGCRTFLVIFFTFWYTTLIFSGWSLWKIEVWMSRFKGLLFIQLIRIWTCPQNTLIDHTPRPLKRFLLLHT